MSYRCADEDRPKAYERYVADGPQEASR